MKKSPTIALVALVARVGEAGEGEVTVSRRGGVRFS